MREHLHPAIASTRTTTRTSALSITDQIRRDRVHPSTSITTQSPRARGRPRAAYVRAAGAAHSVSVAPILATTLLLGARANDTRQTHQPPGGLRTTLTPILQQA